MTSNALVVKNPYDKKTFQNYNGESVIDLVITSQSVSSQIENILIEENTLTPHSSVYFTYKGCLTKDKIGVRVINYEKLEMEINSNFFDKWIEEFNKCDSPILLQTKIEEFCTNLTMIVTEAEEEKTGSD